VILIAYKSLSLSVAKSYLRQRHRLNSIRYDLKMLRMLSEPTTVYDVIKKLNYPHSSAHSLLQQYLRQGIISSIRIERYRSGLNKRYYMLTELGNRLLSLLEKVNNNRFNALPRDKDRK